MKVRQSVYRFINLEETLMSAEYLGTSTTISDHDVTLTIMGDAVSMRPRLVEAVQKLGYTVLGEQPLHARRGAQGGARWDCSFEVLDYPTRITISLRQVNDICVIATFNYEFKSYRGLTKGDQQTLLREAEAIAALASERLSLSACPACATPITDDSHFCRRCGAPLAVEVTELEVLRLTRKARTAHHNLVLGVMLLFLASLVLLPLLWVEPKLFKVLLVIGPALGTFGLIAMLQGVWQLHYALNPKPAEAMPRPQPTLTTPLTKALQQAPSRGSVTEGTTELLVNIDHVSSHAKEPVAVKALDTGEVDDERLM